MPADPDAPPEPAAAGPEPAAPAAPDTVTTSAECGRRLAALFPALFDGPPKPLKLRVHVDIQARAPGVFPRPLLAAFMRRHTGSHAYLQAVARGTQRFGLDGEPAGEISAEHRQAALDELARRKALHAERRAAEERAAQARRADEEAARRARRALLRDFERTTLTEANFCALKGIDPAQWPALLAQARREAQEHPPHPHPRPHPPRGPRPERGPAPGGRPRPR